MQKESIVTKRVASGELLLVAEYKTPLQLAEKAEGESSRLSLFSGGFSN